MCCEECFADVFLKAKIRENNKIAKCEYCGEDNVYITNIKKLNPYFSRLLNLYTHTESYEHYDPDIEHPYEVGCALITLINEDWFIFLK
ncbi:hypothetical protein JQK62_24615, partial [Leptospira santarosai]|nr:hypothetical protein [Leptospira santarosai]